MDTYTRPSSQCSRSMASSPLAAPTQDDLIGSAENEAPYALPIAAPTPSRLIEPLKIQLYDPPVPRAIPPPMTSERSTYSRLPTPGRQSPSIRDLDKRSMVKQRLADLERTASPSSPSSSPARSTRSRQIVSPTDLEPGLPRNILLRHGTISSVGQDSIIDSYAGSKAGSPLSPYSQGHLTSIPSGQSIGNEENSWLDRLSKLNIPQVPEKPDLFSPASMYSESAANAKTAAPPPATPTPTSQAPPSISRLLDSYRRASPTVTTAPLRLRDPAPSIPAKAKPESAEDIRAAARPPPISIPSARALPVLPPSPQRAFVPPPAVVDVESRARLSNIRTQISDVQNELRNLPETLGAIVAEHPPVVLPPPPPKDDETGILLQGIDETVKRALDQGERHAEGLAGIQTKVDAIMQLQQAVPEVQAANLPAETVDAIMGKLEELGVLLKSDLPALSQRLEELAAQRAEQVSVAEEGAPSAPAVEGDSAQAQPAQVVEDTADLQGKLEEILAAIQASQPAPVPAEGREGTIEQPASAPMASFRVLLLCLKLIVFAA